MKKVKQIKLLLLTLLSLGFVTLQAQQRNCGTDALMQEQLQNPEFTEKRARIAQVTKNYLQQGSQQRMNGSTIVIPCLINIIYATASANISDEQIQSQIDRLNLDFAATNSDYGNAPSEFSGIGAGDMGIRFEIAEVRRYSDETSEWSSDSALKTAYPAIDSEHILNIWVCNIGGGTLGYAYFPGTAPSTYDGVVIGTTFFGDASSSLNDGSFNIHSTYNLGRTATHEVGHWLNLSHVWGDSGGCSDDDSVSDTPITSGPNYGCPSYPTNSCSASGNDMTMNYMDYVDDACMYMFSTGQKNRMFATFESGGGREGFLSDPVHNYDPCAPLSSLIFENIAETSATISWDYVFNNKGFKLRHATASTSWQNATEVNIDTGATSYSLANLQAGTQYKVWVQTQCDGDKSSWKSSTFTTNELLCSDVSAISIATSPSEAVITWAGSQNAMSYNLRYGVAGTSWATATQTTSSSDSTALTGLNPNTKYRIWIQSVCSSSINSGWQSTTFTTDELLCSDVSSISATTSSSNATIIWTGNQNAISYNLRYGVAGTSWANATQTTSSSESATFTGLNANTKYRIWIQSVCSSSINSGWQSTTFTTSTFCPDPSGLTTEHNNGTTTISWNSHGDNVGYKLRYAPLGTSWSNATEVVLGTDVNSYEIASGLNSNSDYRYWVQMLCNGGNKTAWSSNVFNSGCTENLVTFSLNFDNYPEETTWVLSETGGSTISSGSGSTANNGGLADDGSTYVYEFCLSDGDYTFIIEDNIGDGICCGFGSGSYTLTGPNGVIVTGSDFGDIEVTSFTLGNSSSRKGNQLQSRQPLEQFVATVYPNPSKGFINIDVVNAIEPVSIAIYDMVGKVVYQNTLSNHRDFAQKTQIDLASYGQGMYIVKVQSGIYSTNHKLIID